MSTSEKQIHVGKVYKHFKGNNYKVIAVAKSSENPNQEFVVYETLYDNPTGKFWIRPLAMFLENVIQNGKSIPRFSLIQD